MKNKCCNGTCRKEKEKASNEVVGFLFIILTVLGSIAATLTLIF